MVVVVAAAVVVVVDVGMTREDVVVTVLITEFTDWLDITILD